MPSAPKENACACRVCGAAISDRPPVVCPACLLESSIGFHRAAPGGFAPPEPEVLNPAIPGIDIVGLIGQGGMGAVYLGEPEGGGEPVAVKVLAPKFFGNPELRKRFEREAEILAWLDHPGIVPLHRSGETGDILYLVMDFIAGPTLDKAPRHPPETTIKLGIDLCTALAYAHEKGIAHRDLKPSNILLDHDTHSPKIADFGLAKPSSLRAGATLLTSLNQSLGTPRYMAPEQWEGRQADGRSDIYALGAILYERLTGAAPSGSFKKPSAISDAESKFDAPIMKALAADPAERFATAEEFSSALERSRRPKTSRRLYLAAAAALAASLIFLIPQNRQVTTLTPIEIDLPPAITSPRETTHNYLGRFLSTDDDLIIVGAPCASETMRISGSGYTLVYRPTGSATAGDFNLGQPTILENPHPESGDRFGYGVSHSDDTIICGAWGTRKSKGSAHIFSSDGTHLQTLEPPAEFDQGRYGFDVAIDGNTLAVSTPGTGSATPGRVFIYERKDAQSEFTLTTNLSPEGLSPEARFGRCIALDGDTLAIGCYNYSDRKAPARGAAFIYQRKTGTFEFAQKLIPKNSQRGDHYGSRITLHDGWLVLNAWKADVGQKDSGASAVFRLQNGSWREHETLSAGTRATARGNFGSGAWLGKDTLLLGAAATRTESTTLAGEIYAYAKHGNHWSPTALMQGTGANRFGTTAGLSRGMVISGANHYDRWRGGVWVFPLAAPKTSQ